MRYLLLHIFDEDVLAAWDDPEADREMDEWVSEIEKSGADLYSGALQPTSEATTVRVRAGKLLVTDGPFAETKEQIAGINVLECDSMQEAVELAARHPSARAGTFEIRQFVD